MKGKFKGIIDALEIIEKIFNISFDVRIVEGDGASIQPNNFINIGLNYLKQLDREQLKGIVFHESFHQIFPELNQMWLKEKSEKTGIKWENDPEYYESEINNWEKVKEVFPEFSNVCDNAIKSCLSRIESLNNPL